MTKYELIQSIRDLNSTASEDFLSQFNEDELTEYLEHLMAVDTSDLTALTPSLPYN